MSTIKPVGETHDQPWQNVMAITAFPMQALVYEVRATDGHGNPVVVDYEGKPDPEGTLYIGEQTDDVLRFKNLIEGFQLKKGNHDAPMKYFKEGWDKKHPLATLEAKVTLMARPSLSGKNYTRADGTSTTNAPKHTATDGKVKGTSEECRRLNAKEHKIGRIPPLNRKRGGRIKKEPLMPVDPKSGDDTGIS